MRKTVALVALTVAVLAGCRGRVEPDPVYLADLQRFRASRLSSLTSPAGWLSVVGLFWLKPGDNSFGSAPDNAIPLKQGPAIAGSFQLRADGPVVLRAAPGTTLAVNGALVAQSRLTSDHGGKADVVELGTLTLYLIERGGAVAVRVKDRASQARTEFAGLSYFPADLRYRVTARLAPYTTGRPVEVPSAHGPAQRMLAPGVVRFSLLGVEHELEPFISTPGDTDLFFVFRDRTSGRSTYGAGRFLDTTLAHDGTVVLDFNRAYNPPCAFTPYATCPLPPPGNVLPVAVEAGELAPEGH
jgi:hypothetical protein